MPSFNIAHMKLAKATRHELPNSAAIGRCVALCCPRNSPALVIGTLWASVRHLMTVLQICARFYVLKRVGWFAIFGIPDAGHAIYHRHGDKMCKSMY